MYNSYTQYSDYHYYYYYYYYYYNCLDYCGNNCRKGSIFSKKIAILLLIFAIYLSHWNLTLKIEIKEYIFNFSTENLFLKM